MAGFLSGDVKVPLIGKLPKAAVGGGLAVVGYAIYKYRADHASSSAAAGPAAAAGTAGGDPYPADGTTGNPSDLYSIDPATGITYGDEQAGYGGTGGYAGAAGTTDAFPWDGTTGDPGDPYSLDPGTGTTYGNEGTSGGSSVGNQATNGPPFTSNAAWSQYSINYLTSTLGLNASTVVDAIGLYIAGRPVTAAQESTINEAIAVAGPPPISGPNNMPPSINVSGSKTGGGSTAQNPVAALHATARTTEADVSWKAAAHATSYRVIINGSGGARQSTTEVSGTKTTLHDLKRKTHYQVKVLALPTNSSGYSHEASTSITTK